MCRLAPTSIRLDHPFTKYQGYSNATVNPRMGLRLGAYPQVRSAPATALIATVVL
jgi:hypothetical protein